MRRRGFTYIELGMVIAVLCLLSALIVPSVTRTEQSQKEIRFRSQIMAMVQDAQTRSARGGETIALGYDKTTTTLSVYLEPSDGQIQQVKTLVFPDYVRVTKLSADRDESPADGWRVPFFMDGTSSGGGMELSINGDSWSLIVPKGTGDPDLVKGQLPDLSQRRWQAGTYAQRS